MVLTVTAISNIFLLSEPVAPSNKDAIYYEHRIPSTMIYGGLIGPRFASAASPSAIRVSTLFVSSYSFHSVDGESEIDRERSESVTEFFGITRRNLKMGENQVVNG